jgi:hypothetical protein
MAAESGQPVMSPSPELIEPAVEHPIHLSPSPPASPDKAGEIRQLVRKLMDTRDNVTRDEFTTLVTTTDGDLDMLLRRLERLCGEARMGFDHFMLLCAKIQSMVTVR